MLKLFVTGKLGMFSRRRKYRLSIEFTLTSPLPNIPYLNLIVSSAIILQRIFQHTTLFFQEMYPLFSKANVSIALDNKVIEVLKLVFATRSI